ncbi:hypothetical protein F4861DRAFT_469900 [Xylaria intraflava]|nr:hypothetical protein F4861DRAFT_469900 [Xylaria intraflava]
MAQKQTILPKGIVLNTNSIYEEIAKFDVIPVERILRACHVFTTTSRRLYDPTARRLENFWTRVLGGDRRYLSGRVIARLFKEISEETSFVKLHGPENRYEPPSPESPTSVSRDNQAASLVPTSKPKGKPTAPSTKTPHPILKKPRGPSASGPRPTARFVSPPEPGITKNDDRPRDTVGCTTAVSNDGSSKESGTLSTKEEKRKGLIQKSKKTTAFVASTSSRRRPGISRKSNSQSSTGTSDTAPKDGDPSLGPNNDGSQDSVQAIVEKPEQQPTGAKKGKGSTGLSAKAAGKRPVTQPRVEKSTSKSKTTRSHQPQEGAPIARQEQVEVERQRSSSRLEDEDKRAGNAEDWSDTFPAAAVQRHQRHQRHEAQDQPHFVSTPSMNRSASDTGPIRAIPREASRAHVAPSSLMASTLAKVDTSVIGQGTISRFSESKPSQEIPVSGLLGESDDNRAHEEASQSSSVSGLYQQFTPTPPSNTAIPPLARSKSQLSVLLDRQAEKKPKR